MTDLAPGTLLADRFEIVGVLGRGGMATVLLAQDRLRDERVAVKVLHPHLASDPSMQARLKREVQAAARVRHPAALVAHELHQADGHTFLTLPYHPGQTLSERVTAQGKLSPDEVRALGVRLAEALAQAHRAGVLHRDVNPNNVMVTVDGEAMLMDFGLARLHGGATGHTTGVLGTTGYAAPEALDGSRGDPRSDLYGLGATLYLALTGQPPFAADTPLGVVQRQLADDPTTPSDLGVTVPQDLEATVLALLARDPEERPQAAAEVARSLRDARPPASLVAVPAPALPVGPWTVVVGETGEDRGRRKALRVARGLRPSSAGIDVAIFFRKNIWGGVKQALGIPQGQTPEELLIRGLSRSAGLPDGSLTTPDALLEPRFRLVGGVDEQTAETLREAASIAGFKAQSFRIATPEPAPGLLRNRWAWVLAALAAAAIGSVTLGHVFYAIAAVALSILTVLLWGISARAPSDVRDPAWAQGLPLAYPSLEGSLAAGHRVEATLAQRVQRRLDLLEEELEQGRTDFTEAALVSGRETLRRLQAEGLALAEELVELDRQLAGTVESLRPDAELAWLTTRRDRLCTRQRAGESVDSEELARVITEIEDQDAVSSVVEALQSRRTSTITRLLELAASVQRARQDLARARAADSPAAPVLERLAQASDALDDARKAQGAQAIETRS